MAEATMRCPHCHSEAVVKYGKTSTGKERFRCQQTPQCGRTFLRSYAYAGCLPAVKQQREARSAQPPEVQPPVPLERQPHAP